MTFIKSKEMLRNDVHKIDRKSVGMTFIKSNRNRWGRRSYIVEQKSLGMRIIKSNGNRWKWSSWDQTKIVANDVYELERTSLIESNGNQSEIDVFEIERKSLGMTFMKSEAIHGGWRLSIRTEIFDYVHKIEGLRWEWRPWNQTEIVGNDVHRIE